LKPSYPGSSFIVLRDAIGLPAYYGTTGANRGRNAAKLMAIRRTMAEIQPLLPEYTILLKGEDLSRRFFGDELLRSTTDIDLLVDHVDVIPLAQELRQVGFTPHSEFRPWSLNQLVLRPPAGLPLVEIHWRLTLPGLPTIPFTELLEKSESFTGLNVLGPAHLLCHLSFHLLQHSGHKKGLFDIAAWLDRWGDTAYMNEAGAVMRSIGAESVVRWAFKLLDGIVGTRWSDRVADHAASDVCAEEMIRSWVTNESRQEWVEYLVQGLLRVATLDRPSIRRHALVRHLLSGTHRPGGILGPILFGKEIRE